MLAQLKQQACPIKGCHGSLHTSEDHYECCDCGVQVWAPEQQNLSTMPSAETNPEMYSSLMQPEGLIIKGSTRSSGRKRKKPPKKHEAQYVEV